MKSIPRTLALSGAVVALTLLTGAVEAGAKTKHQKPHAMSAAATHVERKATPVQVGARQVMKFATIVGDNARPIQSRNNRLLISAR